MLLQRAACKTIKQVFFFVDLYYTEGFEKIVEVIVNKYLGYYFNTKNNKTIRQIVEEQADDDKKLKYVHKKSY